MNLRDLLILLRHVTIKSFEKGETLMQKGTNKKEVFFIRKGLVRSYSINENGDEITFQLYPEHQIFGNVHQILFNEPSHFSYQALEHTKVYTIDYNYFHKATAKDPKLTEINRSHLGNKILKQAFNRVESFVFMSPEERYLKYMNDYPSVINRAPDKYIAHVLGITPVSLSRIKGRIASKK